MKRNDRRILLLGMILLISQSLRLWLAKLGGQSFWPDSYRYLRSLNLLTYLRNSEWNNALDCLTALPSPGTALTGAIPALCNYIYSGCLGLPFWETYQDTMWVSGAIFTFYSTANIGLIYLIARVFGGTRTEGLWAAFLLACSNSMFYWCRFTLPYDASISMALVGLYIGIRMPSRRLGAFVCGLLIGLSVYIYSGAWAWAITVSGLYAVHTIRVVKQRLLSTALSLGAGLMGSLVPWLGLGYLWQGEAYLSKMSAVGGQVTMGDMSEGWSLPWEYLWYSDRGILLTWLACVFWLSYLLLKNKTRPALRCVIYILGIAGLYGLLVLASNGFHKFVVYGRSVRPMIPFFCLFSAYTISQTRSVVVKYALTVILCLHAYSGFLPHFQMVFPEQLVEQVYKEYGAVRRDVTLVGPNIRGNDLPVSNERYVLLNAQILFPIRGVKPPFAGAVVERYDHPLTYRPYQYVSYKPCERRILREEDISMRLVFLPDNTMSNKPVGSVK